MLNMVFETFFLTNVGLPNSTFNSNSGHTPRLRAVTIICPDSFYFHFEFSPVENICFRLELVFFKHSKFLDSIFLLQ